MGATSLREPQYKENLISAFKATCAQKEAIGSPEDQKLIIKSQAEVPGNVTAFGVGLCRFAGTGSMSSLFANGLASKPRRQTTPELPPSAMGTAEPWNDE